jgi:hypothetical protein
MEGMKFKKAFGKIYGVELTNNERKAVNEEITRQFMELESKYTKDNDASILLTLHSCFGFGKKRLRRFWEFYFKEQARLREYYQLDTHEGNLCKFKLKQIGVDIDEWHREKDRKEDEGK